MLSYAFQELRKNNYENVTKEEFEHILDIFAEILYRGVSEQLKQGLYKEYIEQHETLSTMRGRLNINGTICNIIQHKRYLDCEYDELSINTQLNRILKSTMLLLVRSEDVNTRRKQQLRSILPFFNDVDECNLRNIRWSTMRFQRNNRSYRMLMNICYFILDGMLMTTESGEYKMSAFSEEHMNKLFERFVLEFYRAEHKDLDVSAPEIKWDIDYEAECCIEFLPKMQSDIVLKKNKRTFIIDTKYYGKTLSSHFDKKTLHSANLYQIFAYVKNHDNEQSGNVAGILLYAKTSEEVSADMTVTLGKNQFWVKTLDLNQEFEDIKRQLSDIRALYLS
jgi:5-methylcytosine-specific restriction enzyme subunit McrC